MTSTVSTPTSEPKPNSAGKQNALPKVAPITAEQLAIIKATVPVLQAHGETIATLMYKTLIAAHPDLRDVFNHTSQATGAQPRALARAVLAYATYIDNLPKLTDAIERIAQKHASLFIQPAQYDFVGTHLLSAIGVVLDGNNVAPATIPTPAIIDAWTAAYGVLASVFIGREAQLYAADGGWTGWRAFRIARKVREADDIASFHLAPADGGPLAPFLPGQYVSLRVPVPALGQRRQSRQFSLSAWPPGADGGDCEQQRQCYRVSVKKEEERDAEGGHSVHVPGGMVTRLLHGSYREGDTVELSHPHGAFVLDPADVSKAGAPAVLVSAGVGATPLVAMLQALVQPQPQPSSSSSSSWASAAVARPVAWVHTSRSRGALPFAEEVAAAVGRGRQRGQVVRHHVHVRHEVDSGVARPRLDIAGLDQEKELFVHDGRAEYYICGPEQFMLDVRKKLVALGVAKERVFLEVFATGDVQQE